MSGIKKVLVTGASRGIGKAIAIDLGSRGYDVGIHYQHHRGDAEEVARMVTEAGGTAALFQADLADPAAVTALAESAWEVMGKIDSLINNAGVSYKKLFLETTPEDLDLFMGVNCKGTFLLTQQIAMKMVRHSVEGSIYTITSVNGIRPGVGLSAYGASKSALETLMQGAALELAPHNIRVNTLAVGAIQTDINADVWQNPGLLQTVNEGIPMKRFGQAAEIAAVVGNLLEADSYMTGSAIVIDGGLLLMRGYGKPEKYQS